MKTVSSSDSIGARGRREAASTLGLGNIWDTPILLTIRRLFTLHVRKGQFCEGHFAAMIANGHFAAILDRLENIRVEMDGGFVLDDRILDEPFVPPDPSERRLPWEDVEASRRNRRLQRKHPVEEGKKGWLAEAKACPQCQTPLEALTWFYFESPKETWEMQCGTAGGRWSAKDAVSRLITFPK
jgi:hypothetical protein